MRVISDLHIHGRFSRACSKDITIPNLEKYARVKGVNLLGTGDFTHPLWLKELKGNLEDDGNGILKTKSGFNFVLQTEISLIYSQGGKGRRIHNIVLAPNLEVVSQINDALCKRGRLDYDGRPIFNIPCPEFVDMMMKISKDIEIVPAHCLPEESLIHTNKSFKKILDIQPGDKVYTHNNQWQKVTKLFNRPFSGKLFYIRPWYFTQGLKTTSEHPFYAIKGYKCSWIKGLCKKSCSKLSECKNRRFERYLREWIPASELKNGDFLVYPRFNKTVSIKKIKDIKVTSSLCRLIGYYLAEGYTIREEGIGFSFNKDEKEYIKEVVCLIKKIFNKKEFKIDQRKGTDLIFYSKQLNSFFSYFYNLEEKRANSKALPPCMLEISLDKQIEILRGWYRGDKGYTVSRELINQMKIICLRLGIIPNILKDSTENYEKRGKHFIKGRKIKANYDLYSFNNLSFFEDKFGLLKEKEFKKFKTKMSRRHGWIDKDYAYLPIRKIETEYYKGNVYNLEVEKDNSYVSEFCCVHNCWTPWFALFGSNSGFDSLKECFQDQTKNIHAIETGLSSDPPMNWRLSQLDNISVLSFSDSHSFWPWRIGREATIFDLDLSYKSLLKAIRTGEGLSATVDVDPNFGKYHLTGHRLCNVKLTPKESLKLDNICPKCGKPLTVGVLQRVDQLADRPEGFKPKNAKPFYSVIPLSEILATILGKAVSTKVVWGEYNKLISSFGSEFNVLLHASFDDLKKVTSEKIADVLIKNRNHEISISAGYDGVYGEPIIGAVELKQLKSQKSLLEF